MATTAPVRKVSPAPPYPSMGGHQARLLQKLSIVGTTLSTARVTSQIYPHSRIVTSCRNARQRWEIAVYGGKCPTAV
jgi:hypothetical protein